LAVKLIDWAGLLDLPLDVVTSRESTRALVQREENLRKRGTWGGRKEEEKPQVIGAERRHVFVGV